MNNREEIGPIAMEMGRHYFPGTTLKENIMWSTTQGPRTLCDAEAVLLLGAIGVMVDHLVDELRDDADPIRYGIDWFDQWEPEQRLWLIEHVTVALLDATDPPEAAAILDATLDVVFCEIRELVELELSDFGSNSSREKNGSWRHNVIRAFQSQTDRPPSIDLDCVDMSSWNRLISRVADCIGGVRVYVDAEGFRDGSPERLARHLLGKGVSEEYLNRIPPVVSVGRAQLAIDRIQKRVFHD